MSVTMNSELTDVPEERRFELTPEEATAFGGSPPAASVPGTPGFFNRSRVLIALCIGFAVVVGGGLLLNIGGEKKTKEADAAADRMARAPSEFLSRELEKSLSAKPDPDDGAALLPEAVPVAYEADAASPAGALARPEFISASAPPAAPQATGRTAGGTGAGGSAAAPPDPLLAAYVSPLVPRVEGSLFETSLTPAQTSQAAYSAASPYQSAFSPGYQEALATAAAASRPASYGTPDPYAMQNNQEDKQGFYDAASGGEAAFGAFIGDNALWIGTVIPGILVTAINTDLPGNVIARTTENIYDSKTGKNLLIPQGTTLVARYNSSVSYAQRRIQIVWDTLIRPDGFMLELDGANGVDAKGMSGVKAEYRENWFEYLKAAGIITMFSIANSKMTEEAAKYASTETAGSIAQANAEFVTQTGGTIVSRALNVQPTLTLNSGTIINIMLNKNLYLPPLADYPVRTRYTLK
jgi:type IV secretion system protein VirB10